MARSTVDSLLRTTQAYCEQLCDKETLDAGVAFYSERFAAVAQANQFREIWIDDPSTIPQAWEQGARWFGNRGLRCLRCAPAGGQPSAALSSFLVEQGFTPRVYSAMVLTKWVEIAPVATLRILPARAMRAAFRETIERTTAATDSAAVGQIVAAYEDRLDDPPFDMFVAMKEHEPAGCCALYQVGDVARVMDLAMLDGCDDAHVGVALVGHLLTIARRLAMKHVYVQVPLDDRPRRATAS